MTTEVTDNPSASRFEMTIDGELVGYLEYHEQDGTYELRPHDSERFPGTYALVNETLGVYYQTRPAGQTWGRTAILIHVGNRVKDVIGCVAVGLEHGELYGSRAVLSSRQAMEQLRGMLGRNYHELVIRPTRGTSEEPA